MAAFETNRPTEAGTLFGGRLGNVITAILGALAAWNDARVTRNALARLSDRELEDIGLTRGDIETIGRRGR